jgi:hypothetical protein
MMQAHEPGRIPTRAEKLAMEIFENGREVAFEQPHITTTIEKHLKAAGEEGAAAERYSGSATLVVRSVLLLVFVVLTVLTSIGWYSAAVHGPLIVRPTPSTSALQDQYYRGIYDFCGYVVLSATPPPPVSQAEATCNDAVTGTKKADWFSNNSPGYVK